MDSIKLELGQSTIIRFPTFIKFTDHAIIIIKLTVITFINLYCIHNIISHFIQYCATLPTNQHFWILSSQRNLSINPF